MWLFSSLCTPSSAPMARPPPLLRSGTARWAATGGCLAPPPFSFFLAWSTAFPHWRRIQAKEERGREGGSTKKKESYGGQLRHHVPFLA